MSIPIIKIYEIFGKFFTKHSLIKIDSDFCQLLKEDSIVLDENSKKLISPNIQEAISEALSKHEYVFVKLNNKSATDASFMVTQLKCFTIDEIIMIIKGSQRIMDNFDYNNDNNNILILKEWYKIEHRNEFRCFVANNQLKGISQRYLDLYEKYEEDELKNIKTRIIDFINNDISEGINSLVTEIKKENNEIYIIFDLVYLQKKDKIKIIDIEIDKETLTENLKEDEEENEHEHKLKLYDSWDELKKVEKVEDIELRYIQNENDERIVKPSENINQFPLELFETDIETLIQKINTKNNL